MPEQVLAATTFRVMKTEIREYAFPEIPPEAGILKIEAAGVRGSDWQACQSDRVTLEEYLMATYRFGLADVDLAVRPVGGQGAAGAIHTTVLPWS